MSDERIERPLNKLSDAVERLKEALEDYPNPSRDVEIDGTIQRFEFTFELAWKGLKKCLEMEEEIELNFPLETLKAAYKKRWIEDEEIWTQMRKDRNLTSHTYNRDLAMKVYKNIAEIYLQELEKLNNFLQEKFGNMNAGTT